MKFPFFASFLIFILVLQHNMRKNKKNHEEQETAFWQRELSANNVRKHSLDELMYVDFSAESFYPISLLDAASSKKFLTDHPQAGDILSRFLYLENQKLVNLTEFTNTDLKLKYGVANLNTLIEYDTNYNELITLLHNYGNIFLENGYEKQALTIFEYAISIGTDISDTYISCAKIYYDANDRDSISNLKRKAETISTSRKDSIIAKLNTLYPDF